MRHVYQFPRAAITKYFKLGGLEQQKKHYPMFKEVRGQKSRYGKEPTPLETCKQIFPLCYTPFAVLVALEMFSL